MAHHGQPLPVLTDVQREAQQREAAEQEQAKHNKQEDKWSYAKPHELDARDPSLKDGLDAVKLKQWRRQTMKLLSTAGMNLKIPQWGIAAAALLCQRFFSRRSMKKNDKYQIAMACLHLAAKMEESPKPIREVVKECQRVVLGRQTQKLKKALEPDAIDACKDEVLVAERAVLYTLGFDLHVEHPYKFLVQHLSELGLLHANTQDTPFKHFMQNTWNFLNDSFRSNLCLQYPPYTIAMGALWCANQINVRIHGPSGDIMVAVKEKKGLDTTFFKYFKISIEQATDMANQILEMYEEIKRNPVKASNTPSLPGSNSQLLSPIG